MKKILVLFIGIFSAVIIGCSKDEGGESYDYSYDNLLGKYSLTSFEKKVVITETVQSFPVVTKTTSKGDTFSITYIFNSDNKVTQDGTYRITEKKEQDNRVRDTAYIVVRNQYKQSFSTKVSAQELEMGGITYKVKDFSVKGFKISHQGEKTVDGVKTETTIEAEFRK